MSALHSATHISPSILNCDFMRIGEELDAIANADYAHVDIMDGHFVPNLTFGTAMVEQIVRRCPVPVDTHLMIEDPDRWAPAYAEAGAASVTFHVEAAAAPVRLANELHAKDALVGAAIRPATGLDAVRHLLPHLDMLLIMTVEPGFGGQAFIPNMLEKIRQARELISAENLPVAIQVDGGVKRETIVRCAEAGANVFVAGSAVYSADSAYEEIEALRTLANKHAHTLA
ncbi:ribulose-phosphate 3-epimerase [Dermabacteraceae bacterium P7074]